MLRGQRPHSLRVYLHGDVVRDVAVPQVTRWRSRVRATISALPWVRIEPLDKAGQLVGPPIDNPDASPAEGLEDLEPDAGSMIAQLAGLQSLMLRAQDVALNRQAKAYEAVLENNARLLEVVSRRLERMEDSYAANFQALQQLLAGGQDDGEDAMAVALAKSLPMLLARNKAAAKPPANGA